MERGTPSAAGVKYLSFIFSSILKVIDIAVIKGLRRPYWGAEDYMNHGADNPYATTSTPTMSKCTRSAHEL